MKISKHLRLSGLLQVLAALMLQSGPVRTINGVAVPSDFPVISIQKYGNTAPGRIFFSSTFFDNDSRNNYIVICENDGTPYFYRKLTRSILGSGDFKAHPNGLLSYYKYINSDDGFFVIMDSTFAEIDTFRCAGNYRTDSHELVFLPNGHVLLVCEEDSIVDMSRIISGGNPAARIVGNHIQEVDSDGNLYWEWRCWDHLDIHDATDINLKQFYVDYVHLNSIAVDTDGHYVVSFRSQSTIAKIHRSTGEILWRLGGRKNQYTIVNDNLKFSSQHHVRPVPGVPGHYTFYDNGNYRFPNATRAVEYALDITQRTAEKVWEYRYPPVTFAYMMGCVQRLENGNTYIDWSTVPPMRSCEVNSQNELLFEMKVDGVSGYRSFRFDWDGQMEKPYLLVESAPEAVHLIFNQFGDNLVSRYEIYSGPSPDSLQFLTTTSRTYAELSSLENHSHVYFRVRSVSGSGTVSAFSDLDSALVQYSNPGMNLIQNGDFSSGTQDWQVSTREEAQAAGSVINGEYRLEVSDSGSDIHHVQLIQSGFPMIQGRNYCFEFDARADAPRPAAPQIRSAGENGTVYSKTSLTNIPVRMKHFAFNFEMTDPTDTQARLVMQCGDSETTCYFDNISVKELPQNEFLQPQEIQADDFRLTPNFPNPFHGITMARVLVPVFSHIRVTLHDIRGREVAVLIDGDIQPGWENLIFQDPGISSGIYFCRLSARPVSSDQTFYLNRKWIFIK